MTGKLPAVAHYRVFVGHNAIKRHSRAYHRILEQNRIAHNAAAPYLDSTENDGVFNSAFYRAAVGNDGVAHL